MNNREPLVSIMIPNRNHSAFLGQCIESALNQTYGHTEIMVLDNCSADNSLEVASRYAKDGVRVCRNPKNIMNASYRVLTLLTKGVYMTLLCADDFIKPTFVEKCVNIFEQHHDVGYVHCERNYIDPDGNVTELDPFYSCSFIAPGHSALPIYMLTDVAQPSQCVMRRSIFEQMYGYETEFDHANADKDLWFRLSLVSNYAYLREKLAFIRIHPSRETITSFRNFYHPLAMYLTLDNQAKLGALGGHRNVLERLPAAYRKLASESVKIAFFCLEENNRPLAKQYGLFARIASGDIVKDAQYIKLQELLEKDGGSSECASRQGTQSDMFLSRKRSYDPPEGFKVIGEGGHAHS
ncbi:MAG: glycosyltransferase [Desulfobacteraceae bacterium]|nr:glycosyltransferase [Desulfobacteraceae bacterium]